MKIKFIDLLTLAFIILKLCGVIDWSWWAVISPFLLSIFVSLLIGIVEGYTEEKKRQKKASTNYKKSSFQDKLEELQKKQSNERNIR